MKWEEKMHFLPGHLGVWGFYGAHGTMVTREWTCLPACLLVWAVEQVLNQVLAQLMGSA